MIDVTVSKSVTIRLDEFTAVSIANAIYDAETINRSSDENFDVMRGLADQLYDALNEGVREVTG